MDILKHGGEVEVKAPGFLREAVIRQIAAIQKMYKNNPQPHVLRLSVWIMGIMLRVGAKHDGKAVLQILGQGQVR